MWLVKTHWWIFLFAALVAISLKITSAFDCAEHLRRLNQTVPYHTGFCYQLENQHRAIENFVFKRQSWYTSNLGTILFKYVDPYIFDLNNDVPRTHLVLFWTSWLNLVERHSRLHYRPSQMIKAWSVDLEDCSVNNCIFTGNRALIDKADAVVIDLQNHIISIPNGEKRRPDQRWIFLTQKSPMSFSEKLSTSEYLVDLKDIFNWSMTYRSDSDIPIPYGRTVPLLNPELVLMDHTELALTKLVPHWYDKQTIIPAAVLMSNCKIEKRVNFIYELRKYLRVDAIGSCFDSYSCAGDIKKDCTVLKDYIFYLVLESSSCRQYITEKCFHNAYSKGAIPVIMGPSLEDCEKLLPPNSFLHVDSYTSVEELAAHIKEIAKSPVYILFYHEWRKTFDIVNEHGHFGTPSPFFCRICEALNFNDIHTKKSYGVDDLKLFMSRDLACNVSYFH